MATVSKAWVGSNSGLPSFRLSGAGELRTVGGRLVGRSNQSSWTVADVMAPVGPTTYTTGVGGTVSVIRPPFGPAGSCMISDLSGRGVLVDLYENIREPYSFRTGSTVYANRRVRANPRADVRAGEMSLVLDSPVRRQALDDLLERPGLKLLTLDQPALGVDSVRVVMVTDVSRLRVSTVGELDYRVRYELGDLPSSFVGAPTVTFGDLAVSGLLWGTDVFFGDLVNFGGGA